MERSLKGPETCTDVSALGKSPAFSAQELPTLKSLANFLVLNHLTVDPQTIGLLGRVLVSFDPIAARAALTTAIRHSQTLHTDRVLWILADRCWEERDLPPPADLFISNVWAHVWGEGRDWAPTESLVVRRYGWQNISGQEYEKAGTITAQLREMYEAERARVVDEWIARLCLEAE